LISSRKSSPCKLKLLWGLWKKSENSN
jgi:hypothetical protein